MKEPKFTAIIHYQQFVEYVTGNLVGCCPMCAAEVLERLRIGEPIFLPHQSCALGYLETRLNFNTEHSGHSSCPLYANQPPALHSNPQE